MNTLEHAVRLLAEKCLDRYNKNANLTTLFIWGAYRH